MTGMRMLIPLVALCSIVSSAHAQDRALAESHFEAGQQAFREQRWAVARIEFQAAYQLSHEPDLLYNLSVVEEKDGHPGEAAGYARRYLAEKGATLSTKDADEVRGRIARLDPAATPPAAAAQPPDTVPPPPTATAVLPQPEQAKSARTANLANGAIIGGGLLTLGGIGCLVGAWTTSQAAQDPDTRYAQWQELANRGRVLNATGLGLTIAGGAVLIGSTAWRIAIAKRK